MDGSHRKPYISLSFDNLIQHSANGTCLTSVSVQEYYRNALGASRLASLGIIA